MPPPRKRLAAYPALFPQKIPCSYKFVTLHEYCAWFDKLTMREVV